MGRLYQMDWLKTLGKWIRIRFFPWSFWSWVDIANINSQHGLGWGLIDNKKVGNIQWLFDVDRDVRKWVEVIVEIEQKIKEYEWYVEQKIWVVEKNICKDYEVISKLLLFSIFEFQN